MENWNWGSKGFHYICLLSAVALGLMTVIGAGGACSNNSNFEVLEAKIISPKNDVNLTEGESVFFTGSF